MLLCKQQGKSPHTAFPLTGRIYLKVQILNHPRSEILCYHSFLFSVFWTLHVPAVQAQKRYMQSVALLKYLVPLCHVSPVKFLGLRMLCKCESLKGKLPFKTQTTFCKSIEQQSSSLNFNSCTTKMLYVSKGLSLKI